MRNKSSSLTIGDTISGIMISLAARGYKSFSASSDRWTRAFAASMPVLVAEAAKRKLNVRFRVRPGPLHGDSPTMNEGLYSLLVRGLVTINYPRGDVYRPTVEATDAIGYFEGLPGDRAMYETLTSRFLEEFDRSRESS